MVGNAGDGVLALFEGGPDGLSLTSAATEPDLPDPTALAFSALTGGQVQFYAATAGREAGRAGGPEPGRRDRSRDHAEPVPDRRGSTGPAAGIVPGPGWQLC